jgi:hypothetical protein
MGHSLGKPFFIAIRGGANRNIKDELEAQAACADCMGPAALGNFTRKPLDDWGGAIGSAGIKVEQ